MLEKLLQELKDGNYTHALRFLNLLIMLLSREADVIDPIAARDEKSKEYGIIIVLDYFVAAMSRYYFSNIKTIASSTEMCWTFHFIIRRIK